MCRIMVSLHDYNFEWGLTELKGLLGLGGGMRSTECYSSF